MCGERRPLSADRECFLEVWLLNSVASWLDLSQSGLGICGSRPGPYLRLSVPDLGAPCGERTHNYFNLTISSKARVCNFGCTWQLVICYEKADAMMRRGSVQICHEFNRGAYASIRSPSKPTCFYGELPRSAIKEILIKR